MIRKTPLKLIITLFCLALGIASLPASVVYWDSNGATPGAGTTPTGIWGTDSYWTSDSAGKTATTGWTDSDTAVFSAGTDASGAFTVTISGSPSAAGITLGEGTVTLTGASVGGTPTITLAGGSLTLNVNSSTLSSSAVTFSDSGIFSQDNVDASAQIDGSYGTLTLSAGNGQVRNINTAAQTITMTFSSLAARGAGATGLFNSAAPATDTIVITAVGDDQTVTNNTPIKGFFQGTTAGGGDQLAFYNGYVTSRAYDNTTDANGTTWKTGAYAANAHNNDIPAGAVATGGWAVGSWRTGGGVTMTMNDTRCYVDFKAPASTLLKRGGGQFAVTASVTQSSLYSSSGELIVRCDQSDDAVVFGCTIGKNTSANRTFTRDDFALIKCGAGVLNLTRNATYTGNTYVNEGTLIIGNGSGAGVLAATPAIIIAKGATFAVDRGGPQTYGIPMSGAGNLYQTNAGALTLTAANTFSGDTRIMGNATPAGGLVLGNQNALQNSTLDMNASDYGTLSFGSLTAATIGGLKGSRDLTLENGSSAAVALSVGNNNATSDSYSGILSGTGSLVKIGSGALILSGANTYSGGTTISGGILRVDTAGPDSGTGTGSVAVNAGGTLSGHGNIAGNVSVANDSSAIIYPNGSTLTVEGDITLGGGDSKLKFNVDTTVASANNDKISMGGSGKTLSITTGTPQIDIYCATTDNLEEANYVLIAGNGNTVPATGGFNSAPNWVGATPGNSGSFTIENVAGDIVLKYAGGPVAPPTKLAFTAVPSQAHVGAGFSVTVQAQNDDNVGSAVTSATLVTLTKASGSGTLSGTLSGTIAAGTSAVVISGILYDVGEENLQLTATASGGDTLASGTSPNIPFVYYPVTLDWGSGDANWTAANVWYDTGTTLPATYHDSGPDSVVLEDTHSGTSPITITLNTVVSPGSVTASATKDYTISGTGGIAGTGGLAKSGTGALTLGTANTYSGDTTISAGTVKLGADNAIPNGASKGNVSLAAPALLDLNGRSDTINGLSGDGTVDSTAAGTPTLTVGDNSVSSTFTGVISNTAGTLSFTKTGGGMLTWTPSISDYSGDTTISEGTLKLSGALGYSPIPWGPGKGNVVVNGTLDVEIPGDGTSQTCLNGLSGSGTITDLNSSVQPVLATGTNNESSTFDGFISNGSHPATGTGVGFKKYGTGTLTLSCPTNSFSAVFDIRGGTVEVTKLANKGTPSSIGTGNKSANDSIIGLGVAGAPSTLRYIGSGDSCNRRVSMWGNNPDGGTIDASGTGPLILAGDTSGTPGVAITCSSPDAMTKTIYLTGNNTDLNNVSGIIQNQNDARNIAVTKKGSGRWGLRAANTYTGNTTISEGTLAVELNGTLGINNSIIVGAGAILDIMLSSASVVLSDTQTLCGPASGTGTINALSGSVDLQMGTLTTLRLTNSPGTASLDITGGALILGANNPVHVIITNSGTPLGASTNLLISASTGSVGGTVPSAVVVNDVGSDGIASGYVASLLLNPDGMAPGLYLSVTPSVEVTAVSATYSSGTFQATFTGAPDTTYAVYYTDNSADNPWTFLKNVVSDGLGNIIVTDTPDPLPNARFYKVVPAL